MSKITILPDTLINKIAAGEVIERPASIVRELVDNSIDAGAGTVSVEILYGGRKLIRVSDDGIGMDRNDASLCFERHATSKIKSEDDLFRLPTLGFRGEALAAIASISKISLVTSSAYAKTGTRIEIGAGHKKEITDAPPSQGTTIEVRDIFYNTPARRKFLKTIPTELSHIIEAVTQKALSCPGISFSLTHNKSEVIYASAANDIKERFIQLYSEELFNDFLEINTDDPVSQGQPAPGSPEFRGIRLYGFISKTDFTRSTRGYQLLFVNRRPVKNPAVSHAVYSAYRDLIPKDRHPAFFLFLEVDPGKVDINVHPAKREVRFESSDEIHTLVEFTIRKALNPRKEGVKDYTAHPSAGFPGGLAGGSRVQGGTIRETLESALQSRDESSAFTGDFQTDFFTSRVMTDVHRYFYIGESFVAEAAAGGLAIIDRHAAHERILYERFLHKLPLEIENLFLPIRVELPAKEYGTILNYKKLLFDFGLDIEDFGANNVIVKTLPKELSRADMKGLLLDIASGIVEEGGSAEGILEKETLSRNIAAKLACHKAVRGKETLNDNELSQLIADLEKTEMPDRCPHGRPTRIVFSLDDLRKMFKRK